MLQKKLIGILKVDVTASTNTVGVGWIARHAGALDCLTTDL